MSGLVKIRGSSRMKLTRSRSHKSGNSSSRSGSISLNSRVLVNKKSKGILRYSGLVHFAEGFWEGIELDKPKGKHNGTVGDKTYFTCKDKHGVFVRSNCVKLLGLLVDSPNKHVVATTIQSAARKRLGRRKSFTSGISRTW